MATPRRLCSKTCLIATCALQIVALSLFLHGYLLSRVELPNISTCGVSAHAGHRQACLAGREYDRLVWIVVDALRFDFVAPRASVPHSACTQDGIACQHTGRMSYPQELASIHVSTRLRKPSIAGFRTLLPSSVSSKQAVMAWRSKLMAETTCLLTICAALGGEACSLCGQRTDHDHATHQGAGHGKERWSASA